MCRKMYNTFENKMATHPSDHNNKFVTFLCEEQDED